MAAWRCTLVAIPDVLKSKGSELANGSPTSMPASMCAWQPNPKQARERGNDAVPCTGENDGNGAARRLKGTPLS